jgi:Sulfotransferase domain
MFTSKQRKVFCIGANKTGTTSMAAAFSSLGLKVGKQSTAELFLHDWARQEYRRIIRYCRSADAFQDLPFSYPGTYEALDKAFPGSRFILTVRNSTDEWFDSLVRFHTKIVGKGRLPTADDLRRFPYRYPGFLWDVARLRYGADQATLYDRALYTRCYEEHNRKARQYFKDRPDDFLELNVADDDAMERLVTFLGYPYTGQPMPHVNASK